MERKKRSSESVRSYLASRDTFVERMARVTGELNDWTVRHREIPPSLIDIARFEGLRAERSGLLAEFGAREDRFVVELLEGLIASPSLVLDLSGAITSTEDEESPSAIP